MDEIVLRAPALGDADAVTVVINEASRRLKGRDEVTTDAVQGWWTQPPPFDLSGDVVLAVSGATVVGYGDLGDQANDGTVFWLDVRGAAVEQVFAELERRAIERLAPGGVVRAIADPHDEVYRGVLEARGYAPIRAGYRMRIDLAGGMFVATWPSGAALRTAVGDADGPLLHDLNERSFADHWGTTPTPYDEWLHLLRELGTPDPSLWFVAEVDGAPAGLALCRPSEWGDPSCGWVSTLGVLPAYRGRGLGTALLTHAFAEFQRRGLPRAALSVDAENTTGAVRLYERAGMRVVERHDTWERRP